MTTTNTDHLRRLVRELVVELAPTLEPSALERPSPTAPRSNLVVSVSTDAELDALVKRIQRLCDDPSTRADLTAGRIRFRLATSAEPSDPTPVIGPARQRLTKQLVTERDVTAAHQAGVALVLAARTVLTPLARDKAKALRVVIERER